MPRLTKRVVEGIQPGAVDVFLWDEEVKGFGVRVKPSGVRSYLIQYRTAEGRSRRLTLGKHGKLTADEARKKARVMLGATTGGADPAEEKKEARRGRGETVAKTFARYLEMHVRAKLKERTADEYERLFHVNASAVLGSMQVEDVRRRDVMQVHDRVAVRGEAGARATVRVLSAFFGWCIKRGYAETNPCVGLDMASPKARERVLDPAEVGEVMRAANALGAPWSLLVAMLAVTGQRLREVANLHWSELDLAAGVWTLPPERTKNGREHRVPLPPRLAALLAVWPRVEIVPGVASPFVFTTTGQTPVSGFSRLKTRLDGAVLVARRAQDSEAAPLPAWRLHDLRRSVATGMGDIGISVPTIERALNHVSGTFGGLVGVYQRQELWAERQRAFAAWEARLIALEDGRPAGNVVPLRGV